MNNPDGVKGNVTLFILSKTESLSGIVQIQRIFPIQATQTPLSLCFRFWMVIKAPGSDSGLVMCHRTGIYVALVSDDSHHIYKSRQ